MRRRHLRRVSYTVTAAALFTLVAMTACSTSGTGANDTVTTRVPVTSSSSTSSPDPARPPARDTDTASAARADLQRLTVVARRPYLSGYQRSCGSGAACSFGPAWTDDQDAVDGHNGCSTRNDVLAAQLSHVKLSSGSRCVVVSGVLRDPYTGTRITFSKSRAYLVPLDRVVPLALAWDLGAARWSQARRQQFANDPTIELLAVDAQSNERKSNDGPADFMPADRTSWCSYDQRFVTILTRYRLEVTAADKAAMSTVLAHC